MRYKDENIWLTQKMLATLYDVTVSAINQHLKRIFADNELQEDSVVKKYLITAVDGKNYNTKHYSLQAIIAVGFKIENERAVQFRKWANQIVKDYTIQGWTMDVERLKSGGSVLTNDFFERQLEKIREISFLNANSIRRLRIFMPPHWTTIPSPQLPSVSLRIRRPKSLWIELITTKKTWGLPVGRELQAEKFINMM